MVALEILPYFRMKDSVIIFLIHDCSGIISGYMKIAFGFLKWLPS